MAAVGKYVIAMLGAGAVAAGSSAPAGAAPPSVSVAGKDGARFSLSGGGSLQRRNGRRWAEFLMTVDVPVAPGAASGVGGGQARTALALAPAGKASVGASLDCGHGGASYVYGTAGRGVRSLVAILASGRRVRMRRFAVPAGWRYRGSIFMALVRSRVGLLDLRARDARGHQLQRRLHVPPRPCTGADFPVPPAESPTGPRRPDPGILTGEAADALVDAQRRWRAAGIRSYDVQSRFLCYCFGLPGWRSSSVRNGRSVRGGATVPSLLRSVVDAIEERPGALTVTYNRYGVPTSILVDHDTRLTDDEYQIAVRRFRRREAGSRRGSSNP